MVKSVFGAYFTALVALAIGISSTKAEPPVGGYAHHSYDSNEGGYPSSSSGYVYGPPKESGIPGVPGRDYPNFSEPPPTSFSCEQQPLPGYYADLETGCQVYHICEKGVKEREPHLCPIGSIFDQQKLTCVWWYEADCQRSAAAAPAVNAAVVSAMEEADALAKARKYAGYGSGRPSGTYGPPSESYGVPSESYGTPSTSYGAPGGSFTGGSGSYNSRSGTFNTLQRAYGAPIRRFGGGSSRGIGGFTRASGSLSRSYGAPSSSYGAPSFGGSGFGNGAPSSTYGAPEVGHNGSPSEEYGVPGTQGGGSYLPPSF